jgi:hypothetical protein
MLRVLDYDRGFRDQAGTLSVDKIVLGELLLAYLTWPGNESQRVDYLQACAAIRLADIWPMITRLRDGSRELDRMAEAAAPLPPKEAAAVERILESHERQQRTLEQEYFNPVIENRKDWLRLVQTSLPAMEKDIEVAISNWRLAGRLLYLSAQMTLHHSEDLRGRRGPSLRKAIFIIESRTSWNRQQIWRAWRRFGCVAHIASGAWQAAAESRVETTDVARLFNDPVCAIDRAIAFQSFAMSFKAPNTKRPLFFNDNFLVYLFPKRQGPKNR